MQFHWDTERSIPMRLATILFALITGASTVAVAQPHRGYDRRDNHGTVYSNTQWTTLAVSVPNTENRHFIKVTPSAGRFDKVRLHIDAGRVLVRQVLVTFSDNTSQKVRV